jgi:hypothetical protein
VQKKCCGSGGYEGVCWSCWDEPAVELRDACGVVCEMEIGEGEADGCGCGGDVAGGMKDELPLALVVEEAERSPGAEESDEEDETESFEDPARVY